MKLDSKRLELIILSGTQLELLVDNLPKLEEELNCSYQAEPIEGHFLDIVKGQAKLTKEDESNAPFHSFWMIVRKSDRVIVGSADFKDVPNDAGEIEIGYGLGKQHEHHGYMTETVEAMCDWALKQKGVKSVIAETLKDNEPSQHVLTRCGFTKYRDDETYWWRLNR